MHGVTMKFIRHGVQINVLKLNKASGSQLNVSCAVDLAMPSIRVITQNCETEYLPKRRERWHIQGDKAFAVKNTNQHCVSAGQLIIIKKAEDCLPVLKKAEESSRNIIREDTVT